MKNILNKLSFIFLTTVLLVFFSIYSFAYLDPTVVTYVIQIVAGVIIAGGAVFVILWKKAKKKVAKTLNIDENKNKIKEDEIVVNEEKTYLKREYKCEYCGKTEIEIKASDECDWSVGEKTITCPVCSAQIKETVVLCDKPEIVNDEKEEK